MMLFSKNNLFLLFCALFCSQIKSMEQRDLIMIIDDYMGLKEPTDRPAIDATLLRLFAALEAKTAPIIVSGSVWRNFAIARYNFNKKKDMPDTAEYIVYNQIYLPINKELSILGAQYGYDAVKLADMITKELTSESPLHILFGSAIDNIEKLAGTAEAQERRKLTKEFACYGALFESTEWDVYTYGHALYVLIPHIYAENVSKRYTEDFLQSLQFKDSMGKMLEKEPALLGIKTNNLTKLTATDAYALPYKEPLIQFTADQGLPMDKLLITHKDTVTAGKTPIIHPFVWNVYLQGHGSYYLDPTSQQLFDKVILTMEENRKDIEEYAGTIFQYTDAETLIPKVQLLIQENKNRLTEVRNKNLTEQVIEIENRLEYLEYALKKAEQLQQFSMLIYNHIFKNPNINIAGMPANAFTQLLQFLNTQVDTSFLFYATCFAGARNLLYPYLTKAGQAMTYNYVIATGTVSDKVTITLFTQLPLAKETFLDPNNIIIKDKIISFVPHRSKMDFEQFFQGLHTGKPFAKTINYVHFDIVEGQLSKSVIRLPGSTNFYVDEIDKQIQKISRVTTSVAKLQGELTIDGIQKHAVVIDTYFVPITIRFKQFLPSIMSSIYEPTIQHGSLANITGYYFKKIIHEGPSFGLVGLTNALTQHAFSNAQSVYHKLGTIDPNVSPIPKIFICDNVFITQTQSTFKKVLIFNKISLPSSITHIEPTDDMIVYVTGMMYTLNNMPIIQAYITTLDKQGKEVTIQFNRELMGEAIEVYHAIFDETKNDLSWKAIDEGLTLIPLKEMLSTVQGPVRVMAELRNNAHNLAQDVAAKTSGKLSQLSAFVEISDMAMDRFETISTSLLAFLNYIKNNPTAVADKAAAIRQATFGIRTALDTLYIALEAGLKQLRSNKEVDVAKEIERWNELLKQIQVLKRRNADILMKLS